MNTTAELSEARHALLQRYLRGGIARDDAKPATIPKRKESGPAPLSYSQQQIWLHSQLAGESLIYNEPVTIHRRGELDVSVLERSFREIVRRHEAWRTTFAWEGDQGVQIVQPPPARLEIPLVDLRSHPHPDGEALRLATEDARRPFDLARGPMYRLRLVRMGDAEHRLFLTLHHIIFDGVSLYRVLLPELVTLYEAFVKGESPQLVELSIQYPDYATWQRNSIKEIPPEHFSYWQNALSALPVLDLKTDHRHLPAQTYAGAMEIFHVPAATSAALKRLSQEQGATPFMTMIAAFMTLLHDCTGQEDIVIGGISGGRNRAETQNLLGCFLNTIPIRCAFSRDRPFTELLAKVRTATLGALSHDEVPFELLVQEFAGKRDSSRAPLFQVLAVIEPPPMDPLPAGWDFTHLDVETGTAKFDLQLGLDDRPEGLMGCFIYKTDLFERETIEALKSRWLKLLDRIAAAPGQRIVDLLQYSEQRPMPPIEWNATRTDYPRDAAIHHVFEEQAQRTPTAVALVFRGAELSYDELNRRANRLARRLQKVGVTRDVSVGVWMERSLEMVIGLLAILKAGGAYVPLDPSYPAERLALMKDDARMPVILTQAHLQDHTVVDDNLLCVDGDDFADEDDTNLANNARAEDLAYIMYTSGSTGTPKGVAVTQRGVVRLVKETDYASFSPNEIFLQLAPISFDASTFEIWGALLNGGKLVVMPPAPPALEEIGRAIAEHGVTTLWLTAGLFNAMVDERLHDLRPLRQLLAGGDVLSVSHVGKALTALKNTRLINGYGPTESTTFACCHTIDPSAPLDGPIPIGKPIANTTVYILDSNLQLVPVGVNGELCIGGGGLARGYWRREELTAEKFVANPFNGEPGERLYKTGDLARWRSDGVIEFLGRLDNQIKLRGYRIEPGEIETALKQQPGVLDCAVVVREETPGDKRLIGYVVGSSSQTELLAALRKTLPDYMVPSAIVALPALPRTPNGKLDRNALPVPASSEQSTDDFTAPKTPLEEKLAAIWAAVLGLERIGTRDNFFDLGGHSLAGLRVVNQLSEALGVHLSPVIFFQAPTIAAMAELLQRNHPAAVVGWIERGAADGALKPKSAGPAESVRPYLGLQLELIAIWEEVLGARRIGIRDNFFELGGSSLLAGEMLQRAEAAFGKTIPLDAFEKNPTVEYLAAELARQAMEEWPSLLKVNDAGTRTPFFYLHGDLSGGGFYSLKLSRALGPDQPFYVLPPQDVRTLPETPTIEGMAAAHLQALRAVRPKGPYVIGGFCLGGMVACELAQQIAASGDTVKMLLVIDAAPEEKGLRALRHLAEVLAKLFRWDDYAQVEHFGQWSLRCEQFALWYQLNVQTQIRLVLRQIRNLIVANVGKLRLQAKPPLSAAEPLVRERNVPLAFMWAAAGYRPRPYSGPVAVLLSEDLLRRGNHIARAWRQLAPKTTVHPLRGRHLECITAHVDTLAGEIDSCLQGSLPK
jgi:aspartate racemase